MAVFSLFLACGVLVQRTDVFAILEFCVRFHLVDELPILSMAGERTYVDLWVGKRYQTVYYLYKLNPFLFMYTNIT